MREIIILSLIAFASAAREFPTVDADYSNLEYDQDAERNDPAPEFPFLREYTFLPEDELTDGVKGNETYRPTILEIIIGRPMRTPFLFPWHHMGPMRPLFPQRPIFDFGLDDEYDDTNRTSDDFLPGDFLPDFFGPHFDGPKVDDLPPNYENSTFEIKDLNGTKVHVNQTIEKKSGDGFNSFFHVKVVKVVPENSTLEERPFEKIPPEESTPKKEIVPEFEIPKTYDDDLNQLDSNKPFRDDENNGVRRGGERTKRSPQSSQFPNTMNTFTADIDPSHLGNYDFFSKLTNERPRFLFRKKSLSLNPENVYGRNFVYKNMDGRSYDYNTFQSQGIPDDNNPTKRVDPIVKSKYAISFEEGNLPIDNVENELLRTYSRYAPKYEDAHNYFNRIPFGTNYAFGPIFPHIRLNPLIYQNIPREIRYINIPYNDFANVPTNSTWKEIENNRNAIIDDAHQPVPSPQKKKVRLIEAVPVPKPSSLDKGKPFSSKYILVPVNHQETDKSTSNSYKESGNKYKGNRYSENDVETILVIRPPDLSRDTRVNSIAAERSDSQQGLVQIDPDVEVFDLSLVLKELEIHD